MTDGRAVGGPRYDLDLATLSRDFYSNENILRTSPRCSRYVFAGEMTTVITNGQKIVKLVILVIGSDIAISAIYLWLIPEFFHGYSSYSILIIGGTMAGMYGGYIIITCGPSGRKISHNVFSLLDVLFDNKLLLDITHPILSRHNDNLINTTAEPWLTFPLKTWPPHCCS